MRNVTKRIDISSPITQDELKSALLRVAEQDVGGLLQARLSYGDSCLKRGGVGFMCNIFRKTDRLEVLAEKPARGERYDLFDIILSDNLADVDGILDTVRDLRRYLMLAEAHLIARGAELPKSRDNRLAEGGENDVCLTEAVKRQTVGIFRSDPTGQERPFGFDPEVDELPSLRTAVVNRD
jgi:hypothetical protein